MVERCKQRGSCETASSSDTESGDAEHGGSHAAGGAAPRQGQEAAATAWLSDDSDAAEGEAAGPKEDVPFYDPDVDVRDEAWVAKLRQGRRSDAILSCPGCLTSVCLDCQQHAERDSHFRAMFVSNCRVDYGRIVQPRAASKHARGKRRRGQVAEPPPGQAQAPPAELFHPVECELCGTHLGVYEAPEEVYHFYQVVASTA